MSAQGFGTGSSERAAAPSAVATQAREGAEEEPRAAAPGPGPGAEEAPPRDQAPSESSLRELFWGED